MPAVGASSWAPMLAVPSALPPDPSAFAFEFKWDGMRALVDARRGSLRIVSRNGLDQADRFPELAGLADALRGRDLALDGEIVAFDAKGRPDFGRLQTRFGLLDRAAIREQARANPAHFLAFDVVRLDGRDTTRLPYRERRRLLESLGFAGPSWGTTPARVGDGDSVLAASRDLGLEGVMAKRLDSSYEQGERSPAWLKVRNRGRQEFVVGGWTEGEGSRLGTFGALLVGVYPGPLPGTKPAPGARRRGTRPAARPRLRFCGRVGSGYRAEDLARLQRALEGLASTRNPFEALPQELSGMTHFVEPRLVVEAEFNGLARNGVLRQASFKGMRTDKQPGDVRWEQAEVKGPWLAPSGADPSVSAS